MTSAAARMAKTRELRKQGKILVPVVLDEPALELLVGCGLLPAQHAGDKVAIAESVQRLIFLLRATQDQRVAAYLRRVAD